MLNEELQMLKLYATQYRLDKIVLSWWGKRSFESTHSYEFLFFHTPTKINGKQSSRAKTAEKYKLQCDS